MSKLTPTIKKFIAKNFKVSNRDLETKIKEKFDMAISYRTIGNFKNSYEGRMISQDIPKTSQKLPTKKNFSKSQKHNGSSQKFDLNYQGFIQLCKDHPSDEFCQYFIERIQPPRYPGRSELMKVLEILREYYNFGDEKK